MSSAEANRPAQPQNLVPGPVAQLFKLVRTLIGAGEQPTGIEPQPDLADTSEYAQGYGRELREQYDQLVEAANDDVRFQHHQLPAHPVGVALRYVLDRDQFNRGNTSGFAGAHAAVDKTAAVVAALRRPDEVRAYADDTFGAAVFHDLHVLHQVHGVDATAVLVELAHRRVDPFMWRVRIAADLDDFVAADIADRGQVDAALHDPLPGPEPY